MTAGQPVLATEARFAGYVILGELGRGGMGVVYKARQLNPDRLVALKVIRADRLAALSAEERRQWVDRFRREASLVAALDQPAHIVTLYEVGEFKGQSYFTMRLIEGGNLAQRLREAEAEGPDRAAARRVREQQASARLLAQVARAVDYAHRRGILHRDLKPANILLDKAGEPLVTDFGLARRLDQTGSLVESAIEGTAAYMSPEQARAAPGAATTGADVYSLGAILYEMLTGRPPFRGGNDFETLIHVQTRDPVPPRKIDRRVSRDLETICLGCLAKESAHRYSSAANVADDLEHWLAGRPIQRRPAGRAERVLKWLKRRPAAAARVLVSTLAVVALVGMGLHFTAQLKAEKDLAEQQRDYAQQQKQAASAQTLLARDEKTKADEERRRAEHARTEAEGQTRLAEDNLALAQRNLFAAQLQRAAVLVERDPGLALRLLDDPLACPARYRDFTWEHFRGLCQRERRALLGHQAGVSSIALSSDGRLLASGGSDRIVKLWEVATGKLLATLTGHRQPVWAVAFTADGNTLASAGGSTGAVPVPGEIKIWDVPQRRLRATRMEPSAVVACLAFTDDGKTLVSGGGAFQFPMYSLRGQPGVIQVWDVETGQEKATLPGHKTAVRALALTPDGQILASASAPIVTAPYVLSEVRLWEVRTGRALRTLAGQQIWAVAFSPDGKTLAAGDTASQGVRLWSVPGWDEQPTLQGGPPAGARTSLAFSPDGQSLAAGHASPFDTTVWDLAKRQLRFHLKGHLGSVNAVAFTTDGQSLVSASADRTLKFWDVAERRQYATVDHGDASSALTLDDASLTSVGPRRIIRWDRPTGRQSVVLSRKGSIYNLVPAISADGRTVAFVDTWAHGDKAVGPVKSSAADAEVLLWDVDRAEVRFRLPLKVKQTRVTAIAFSSDGKTLACGLIGVDAKGKYGTPPGTLKLWDATTGEERAAWKTAYCAGTLAFSPDGKTLAVAHHLDTKVSLWNVETGRERLRIDDLPLQPAPYRTALAFAPDGRTLAVTGTNRLRLGETILWDLAQSSVRLALRGHTSQVACVAFAPDGQTLVTGAAGEIKLWDAVSGQERATLKLDKALVTAIAFSRDGKTLVSASNDRTMQIWGRPLWVPE